MAVEKSAFGKTSEGREISLYTIINQNGMKACVTDIGAVLVNLWVPDKDGKMEDVVLGFDSAEAYLSNPSYFGAVIGPSANRIGGASFEIDDVIYQVAVNDNANNLHSHAQYGYHKRVWDAQILENGVEFSLTDPATMGFPGNKEVRITYILNDENGLELHYHADSDARTILNLTNHTYFNLNGAGNGTILSHELCMMASMYTPADDCSIPVGDIVPVAGTPMDFTRMTTVGDRIDSDFEQLRFAGGYDHNWVIDDWNGELRYFATVKAPESGRIMEVATTLPGVQFYAGNFITRQTGKAGAVYDKRSGLCLETQYYPDSIHHDNFPSCVFGEGKAYDSVTVYRFR